MPLAAVTREDLDKFKFRLPSRVMMSHTDQEGIVNNISFFIYLEQGRFEYFRNLGMTLGAIKKDNIGMAMVESSCRFISPLFFDDVIDIFVRMDGFGKSSYRLAYLIYVPERDVVAAEGHTVSVFVDPQTRKSRPIPDFFKEKIIAFEGEENIKVR